MDRTNAVDLRETCLLWSAGILPAPGRVEPRGPAGRRRSIKSICLCVLLVLAFAANASAQIPASVAGKLSEEPRYLWARAIGTTARNPARAVIVSRHQFERLHPLRTWQDLSALRDYVEWADRAEAAGFNGSEVLASVSTNDLVLLRVPFSSVSASVKVLRDPIGYAVLDPAAETGKVACPAPAPSNQPAGVKRICLKLSSSPASVPDLPAALPLTPVPMIDAAVKEGPQVVAVYGAFLSGSRVRVFSRQGEGEVLYRSPGQVNAKLPSIDEICVEVDGMKSEWTEVEK
jgi:hypothetical protein